MFAPFRKTFNYSGRASRLEFWLFSGFYLLAVLGLSYIDSQLWGWSLKGINPQPLSQAGQILLAAPLVAVAVRRMNEVGLHPTWAFLPIVGFWLTTEISQLGFEIRRANEGARAFAGFFINNAILFLQGGYVLTAILLLLPPNAAPKFLRRQPGSHEAAP